MGGAFLTWQETTAITAGSLSFDAVKAESRTTSSTVTKRPVETGVDITDHVRSNLAEIRLDVFVTNTPIEEDSNIFLYLQEVRGQVAPLSLSDYIGTPPAQQDPGAPFIFTPPLPTLLLPAVPFVGGVVPAPTVRRGLGAAALANSTAKPLFAQTLQFAQPFNAVQETIDLLEQLRTQAVIVSVAARDWVQDNLVITKVTQPRSDASGSGSDISIELSEIRIVQTLTVTAPTIVRAKKPVSSGAKGGSAPGTGAAPTPPASVLSTLTGFGG